MSTSGHLPYVASASPDVVGTSLGPGTGVTRDDQVEIGQNANCSSTSIAAIAVGPNASASGNYTSAFGSNAIASSANAIALGPNTIASGNTSTAIGQAATATLTGALAVGYAASATVNSCIALGRSSVANGTESMALGYGANNATFATSVAIGKNATNTAANQIMLGTTAQTTVCAGTGTALQVAGKIKSNGTVPTFTAVSGVAPAVGSWAAVGNDVAGTATGTSASGAGAFTVTITFSATYTNAPAVMVTPGTNTSALSISTISATAFQVTGTAAAAAPIIIYYMVIGRY